MLENKKEDSVSCELSLYPLGDRNYRQVVLEAINTIKQIKGLEFKINAMNTIIYGKEDKVFKAIRILYEVGKKEDFVLNITLTNTCTKKETFIDHDYDIL